MEPSSTFFSIRILLFHYHGAFFNIHFYTYSFISLSIKHQDYFHTKFLYYHSSVSPAAVFLQAISFADDDWSRNHANAPVPIDPPTELVQSIRSRSGFHCDWIQVQQPVYHSHSLSANILQALLVRL